MIFAWLFRLARPRKFIICEATIVTPETADARRESSTRSDPPADPSTRSDPPADPSGRVLISPSPRLLLLPLMLYQSRIVLSEGAPAMPPLLMLPLRW